MTLGERIAEQHRRAYHGEAWHGPDVFELLEGVSPAKASARPIAKAHTIWEIVLHLTSWERIVRSRLVGEPMDVSAALDWPSLPVKPTKKTWDEARASLHEASEATGVVLARMTDRQILSTRPGTTGTYEELAHGQVQHALYHAGQIALLKKGPLRASRR
jgi:uncharacterized damage-inducible protein DinB